MSGAEGFILPVVTSAVGAGVSAALQPGGATVTSVAKEPPEVERARSAALKTITPILLDLLRSPQAAVQKYLGISEITPPLTGVEMAAQKAAEKLIAEGMRTPLDRLALERAMRLVEAKPSFLLAPEVTAAVEGYLYGPEGQLMKTAEEVKRELTYPASPLLQRTLSRTIWPETLSDFIEGAKTVRDLLEAKQTVQDVADYINAMRTMDRLRAEAADIARAFGGVSGWLETMAKAAPFAALPRLREVQRKGAWEDLMKKAIDATLRALKIPAAGKEVTRQTYGPSFGQSFLSRFASGLGTSIAEYFLNKPVTPNIFNTWSTPSFGTFSVMGPVQAPSWTTAGGFSVLGGTIASSPLTGGGFSLGANIPSVFR